jgi:hypothetical protein
VDVGATRTFLHAESVGGAVSATWTGLQSMTSLDVTSAGAEHFAVNRQGNELVPGNTPYKMLHEVKITNNFQGDGFGNWMYLDGAGLCSGGGLQAFTGYAIINSTCTSTVHGPINAVLAYYNQKGGTVDTGNGLFGQAFCAGTTGAVCTDLAGLEGQVGTGTAGHGAITNGYGLRILTPQGTASNFVNIYGIKIEAQPNGATSGYNLYSVGGSSKNVFEGSVGIGGAVDTVSFSPLMVHGLVNTNNNAGFACRSADNSFSAVLITYDVSNRIVIDNASNSDVLINNAHSGNILLAGGGGGIGVLGHAATTRQTVTGSRGGNAALATFLTAMASFGWITDSSSS